MDGPAIDMAQAEKQRRCDRFFYFISFFCFCFRLCFRFRFLLFCFRGHLRVRKSIPFAFLAHFFSVPLPCCRRRAVVVPLPSHISSEATLCSSVWTDLILPVSPQQISEQKVPRKGKKATLAVVPTPTSAARGTVICSGAHELVTRDGHAGFLIFSLSSHLRRLFGMCQTHLSPPTPPQKQVAGPG